MDIHFYNTLTHQRERFAPLDPPHVYMYNCGPTVYDFAHIGNFRTFIFADVLRRFLELTGHNVQQVMNLTDVGHMTEDQLADGAGQDKMQVAAQRLKEAKKSGLAHAAAIKNPDDPYEVAQFYIDAFLDDARKLGLKIAGEYPAHMPRATEHVGRMIEIILKLVENGHAYRASDGCVYFDVQSFPDYGRLSGNTLDKLRTGSGGRVQDHHQAVKKHPADFLLWKPDPTHLMKWESPWGVGYPGWHIECSAMSSTVLGRLARKDAPLPVIDIHTGGEDNIFPHHECEIAQTRGATGQPLFARFWMHSRHLLVDGEKMSKSKGTFYTVRDLIAKGVDPAVIRFELLKGHYRSNLNFTMKGLEDSASAVRKLRDAAALFTRESPPSPGVPPPGPDHPVLKDFAAALADDLNMSGALGVVFKWLGAEHKNPAESLAVLRRIDSVIKGVWNEGQVDLPGRIVVETNDETLNKSKAIDAARAARDFATADRIRKELIDGGYEVLTTKAGTTARKKLA